MAKDTIANTFEHLGKITDSLPSFLDLLYVRDLWAQLHHYWEVLCEEIERRRGKSHPIRALDFDLIYPTIWSAKVQSPLLLEERMGFPMTASFIFRDTQTYFTIPPGALFELSFRILKLQEVYRLSETNLNRLMRKVYHLRQEISHEEVQQTTHASELLSETVPEFNREVNRLIDYGAKLESLSDILTHKYYRPWNKISEQAKAKADPTEVLKLWRIFSAARTHPDKDLSNYLDALSVASYYSLSRAQAGGRTRDFPLFASGTDIVLNLGPQVINSTEHWRPSLLQEIIHPVSIQYLAFATAMERYAEYDITRLSTLTEAGLRETQRLFQRWRSFWNDCRVIFPQPQHVTEEEHYGSISFSQLTDVSSFRPLCDAYTSWRIHFEDTVEAIFIDITRADRQISQSYHSVKRRLLERIEEGQSSEPRAGPSYVIEDITSTFDWTPLTAVVDSGILLLSSAGRPASRISDQTIELLTLRTSGMLVEEAEVFSEPFPTLRTIVKLSDIKEEVLLTWERSVGHASQLCYWSYGSGMQEALDRLGRFLSEAHSESQDLVPVSMHVFADDLYEEKTFKVDRYDLQLFDAVLSITQNPNYIRIDADACTIFLDVMPPRDSARLEMAVMYEKKLHREVAGLYRDTSLFPLASSVVEALLREFARDFKRKEPLIGKLANRKDI
jgi:hypothetical protein